MQLENCYAYRKWEEDMVVRISHKIKAYARMDDVPIQHRVVDRPPHKENVWVKLNIN